MPLPMDPFPERALRPLLTDTPALERLEAARAGGRGRAAPGRRRCARPARRVFEEITGRPAPRAEGDSSGGRTIAYLDCMRDLDVTLGPAVLDELRALLPAMLYASRWWCGRVFDRGASCSRASPTGALGRLGRCSAELMGAGFGLWNQMGDEQRELQRRWASVVERRWPRAADAFADWTPAWHGSGYHSADLQIAAADADAMARGDFLVVLGDFHGGDNTCSPRHCSACATPTPPA